MKKEGNTLSKVKEFFMTSLNNKGFSSQEIATGMTMAVIVGTIAVVTGNAIVLDTEEKAHVFNAQEMAKAASSIVLNSNSTPDLGAVKSISLADIYAEELLAGLVDPSGENDALYSASASFVQVENTANGLEFYVKLVNIDGDYTYLDETDTADLDRVESKALTRDAIAIPKRDASI